MKSIEKTKAILQMALSGELIHQFLISIYFSRVFFATTIKNMEKIMSDILENRDTIQRCPHDAEHPYAQILNDILRHKTLSIQAIWMLSYLLSNDRKWQIKISQIIKHVKGRIGRNKVYEIISELIEFGYMQRVSIKNGNLHSGYRYFISEIPKFKIILRHPGIRDTEGRDPEIQHTKEQTCSKKKIAKEQQQKVAVAPVVVSSIDEEREEQADAAATQFIKKERARGNKVDETRVRRKALKEGWKPNEEELEPKDIANKFDDGLFYDGKNGMIFECQKNKEGVGFLCGQHLYFIEWKSPTFANDFTELLKKLGLKDE